MHEPSARMQDQNIGDPHTHSTFLLSFCKYDLLMPYGVQNTLRLSRFTAGVTNEDQAFVVVTQLLSGLLYSFCLNQQDYVDLHRSKQWKILQV